MTLRGRRPGDRRVRVERATPVEYRVAPPRRVRQPRSPSAVLVIGFGIVIAIGAVLLALPISSAAGTWTSPLDALFTSTSAVCVTGLAIFDTGTYWSWFGQLVLLVLMQLGGFGFMTGSTLLLFLLVGRRTGLARPDPRPGLDRGARSSGASGRSSRRVAAFTLIAEVVGRGDPDPRLHRRRLGRRSGTGAVVGRVPLGLRLQQRRHRPVRRLPEPGRLRGRPGHPGHARGPDPAGQSRLRDRRRHRGQASLGAAGPRDAGRRPDDRRDPGRRDHGLRRVRVVEPGDARRPAGGLATLQRPLRGDDLADRGFQHGPDRGPARPDARSS